MNDTTVQNDFLKYFKKDELCYNELTYRYNMFKPVDILLLATKFRLCHKDEFWDI